MQPTCTYLPKQTSGAERARCLDLLKTLQSELRTCNSYVSDFVHAAKIFGEEDVTDATFVIEPKAARLAVLLARPTLRSIYISHTPTPRAQVSKCGACYSVTSSSPTPLLSEWGEAHRKSSDEDHLAGNPPRDHCRL